MQSKEMVYHMKACKDSSQQVSMHTQALLFKPIEFYGHAVEDLNGQIGYPAFPSRKLCD